MSADLLMGVDLGTSSTKTVILDRDGNLLSRAAKEYSFDTPRPGWAEQDPQVWVQAALARLQPPDREVLVLRHLEQLSAHEVAVVLGIAESTVRYRQRRALERLGDLLGDLSG